MLRRFWLHLAEIPKLYSLVWGSQTICFSSCRKSKLLQYRSSFLCDCSTIVVLFKGEESRDKQEEKENIKRKEVMITFHDVGMNRKLILNDLMTSLTCLFAMRYF